MEAILLDLLPTKEAFGWSGDVVKASVDSTEEIRVKTERYSSLRGGSGGLLEVHLKK